MFTQTRKTKPHFFNFIQRQIFLVTDSNNNEFANGIPFQFETVFTADEILAKNYLADIHAIVFDHLLHCKT